MRKRIFLISILLTIGASVGWAADRFPPAPDDLTDLDLIDLDLDAIVAEGENLWSFSFVAGYGQSDLGDSEQQAVSIASIEGMFEAVNAQIGDVADIGWSDNGFSDLKTAFSWRASARHKFPEGVMLPGVGMRLGVELTAGRIGSSTRLGENGFGATLTDDAYSYSASALFYLPGNLTSFQIPYLGARRDIFISAGGGIARGRHAIELFVPPRDFSSIPPPILLEATQTNPTWQIGLGGEEYYTPYFSLSWQVGYQSMSFDELMYSDASIATFDDFENREPVAEPLVIGYGDVATVWTPWFPEGNLLGSWGADPSNPIDIDFGGFNFAAGLRYHF